MTGRDDTARQVEAAIAALPIRNDTEEGARLRARDALTYEVGRRRPPPDEWAPVVRKLTRTAGPKTAARELDDLHKAWLAFQKAADGLSVTAKAELDREMNASAVRDSLPGLSPELESAIARLDDRGPGGGARAKDEAADLAFAAATWFRYLTGHDPSRNNYRVPDEQHGERHEPGGAFYRFVAALFAAADISASADAQARAIVRRMAKTPPNSDE